MRRISRWCARLASLINSGRARTPFMGPLSLPQGTWNTVVNLDALPYPSVLGS